MGYKKHSKKTDQEKKYDKWVKAGCPVVFWASNDKGTCDIGNKRAKRLKRCGY